MGAPSHASASRRAIRYSTRSLAIVRDRRSGFGRRCYLVGSSSEEAPDEVEKGGELVVMDPVTGTVERDHTGMPEVAQTTVGLGVCGPAFLAVDEQGGTGDARPELLDLRLRHAVGRIGAGVIVEFPAVSAVFILVDAVLGQVARLLGREVPIGFLHSL